MRGATRYTMLACWALLAVSAMGESGFGAGALASGEDDSVPYIEEEVVFKNKDVTLAGTLTVPKTPGRHPGIVLLHGSGPLDRDQEIYGMRPFRIIADHLTRQGIAVLRYDSRGVGGSSGVPYQYTLMDVAEDALAAVRYLRGRSDLNPGQIGLCGQSQGSIVAPIVASRSDDVAFMVGMACIGVPGDEAHVAQMVSIARADGASQREIEELSDDVRRSIDLVREEGNEAELRAAISAMLGDKLASMSEKEERQTDAVDEGTDSHVDCAMSLYKSQWFRFFIDYDPRPALGQLECPALFMFGGLDTQAPVEVNGPAIEEALKSGVGSDYTLKTISDANHGFQKAKTGSPAEYASLDKEFAPGVLEYLSGWILERVDVAN